ncbi:DUF202 domain-containing protein [Knoellia koreensis]|uniref:DUF202 domain-containing protein n=1 Tax=Knoellia koreensis TaxID=2730921 RepID=A0A849HDX9_9MICO|nr:DUF202 domain-containing protein [Knoellia sp. DB2414S]
MSTFPDRAGLQPERTALAWQRTALTSLVIQVGGVVLALRLGQSVVAILGAIIAGVTSVTVAGVRQRFVELRDDERGYSPHRHMVDVAVATGGAALVGGILAVTVASR